MRHPGCREVKEKLMLKRCIHILSLTCVLLMLSPAILFLFHLPPARAETLEDKVKEFTLKNGMRFLVVERHEAPVVMCAVAFDVGAANDWPSMSGVSHLLEHMLFKGTRQIGTTNYIKEIPYIRKTDELGERTIALRKEIGEWRFALFKEYERQVIAGFSEDEKKLIGTDQNKQITLFVEKVRAMPTLPAALASTPYLIADRGKNFLDRYLEYRLAWGEIKRLLDRQRRYIVTDELTELYTKNGADFWNAFTSYDYTLYFVYLPANRLSLWMTLESDRMEHPIFREFWSERDVVMEERRLGENDPDDVLREAFFSVAFSASPYKTPIVGWMSDILAIDRERLTAYHRVYYAPNNAVAVIVGDVDLKTIKKMAQEYFEPIPAQQAPPAVETREPAQAGERRVVVEHTANPQLMIGYHKPAYPHPDDVVLEVLSRILAVGRLSRLYKTVYEKKKLTAGPPWAYSGPGNRYDNLLIIGAEPRHPHTLEQVEAAIYEEIEQLKREPVTERELQRIKNQYEAWLIRRMDSNITIAFQLAYAQSTKGDYRAILNKVEMIKKVSAADVMEAAKRYLIERNRTVGYRIQVQKEANKDAR
jgi:predicted Zn-dependent peptidase